MNKDARDCILQNYGRLTLADIQGILERVYDIKMALNAIAQVAYDSGLKGGFAEPEAQPYVKGKSVRRQRRTIMAEVEARKLAAKKRIDGEDAPTE